VAATIGTIRAESRGMENKKPAAPAHEVHPIHDVIVDLHFFAKEWLESVRQLRTEVARIRRATARAAGALQVASRGDRRKHHLRLVRESMGWCRSSFLLLFLEGHIPAEVYDEARRRIDQIDSGVKRLESAGDESWSAIEPPPLAAPVSEFEKEPAFKPIRRLLARIAETTRLVQNQRKETADRQQAPSTG
jgi:hypothetical protein